MIAYMSYGMKNMETRIKKCRNCHTSWLYYFDGNVCINQYKNLGWHVNCKCGLANISSIWYDTEEDAILNWNSCVLTEDFE